MAKRSLDRRSFLKTAAGAVGAATQALAPRERASLARGDPLSRTANLYLGVALQDSGEYPRQFRGRELAMISVSTPGVARGKSHPRGPGTTLQLGDIQSPEQGLQAELRISVDLGEGLLPRGCCCRACPGVADLASLLKGRMVSALVRTSRDLSRLESAVFTGEYLRWRSIEFARLDRCS